MMTWGVFVSLASGIEEGASDLLTIPLPSKESFFSWAYPRA